MADITVQELKQRMDAGDNDFVFIDVRESHEYAEFNLGAELIPLGQIMAATDTQLADLKEKEIILHCRSGARSGQAKQLLEMMGFKHVRNMLGGVLAWQDAFGK